jgi:hypothetical protein
LVDGLELYRKSPTGKGKQLEFGEKAFFITDFSKIVKNAIIGRNSNKLITQKNPGKRGLFKSK